MRKALIIGIDNYPKSPLYGCVRDAIEMSNVLEKHSDGSPNFAVKLLTDPNDKLTKGTIKKAIDDLFKGDADVALLYFSGHGFINSLGGFLVTPDYSAYDEGISMDEILSYANNSSCKDKIVILDCCHSGAFGSPKLNNSVAQLGDGLSVLTACRSEEVAIERGGQGIFTSLLLDALQGGAADLRGHITPGSLYAYVDEALGAWDQRPIFKTNVSRFTSIRRITPKIPLETLRKITEYFDTPESEHKLTPEYEFTEKSAVDEKVKIFKDLQKFASVGLVVPVDEEHMYFAAMNNKSCRLTALGFQYWRLVSENKL
ncbi:caspase family protein [Algoriphagus sp. AK58]|uniref:caspase family protein n=1 Tax=Algoriphagus sp. AK58 TaxID=1406877 RepID=UPI001650D25B|nr:caspase family protein [Algoriphagus sp. AK58]MBC6368720.1 peptidase C14 [Algoriphagus sp. AK58]